MKTRALAALAIGLLLTCGCAEDDPVAPEEPRLEFTVSFEPAVLVLGQSVTVTVSAKNPTDSDVHIGAGSSSCALGAVVELDGGRGIMLADRVCTADVSERSIRAGETRTEQWPWSGDIRVDGERLTLPAGTYPVAGTADKLVGDLVTMEIREPLTPEEQIVVSVAMEPRVLQEDQTAVVTVTATNHADVPALLGNGGCMLDAAVDYDAFDHPMDAVRICPRDMGPRYLQPGETWVESWDWAGAIEHFFESTIIDLPPGIYQVRGRAGTLVSQPIDIEIAEPPPLVGQHLAFSVTFDPPTLKVGEPVDVTVRATSVGTEAVLIQAPSSCVFSAIVRYLDTNAPMVTGRVCLQHPISRWLEPGFSMSEHWSWSGSVWYDDGSVALPPGSYEVFGAVSGWVGEPVVLEVVE